MKLNKNVLTADEGYYLAPKDKSAVFGNTIYLGKFDSKDNYVELPIEEAKALQAELDRKLEEELNNMMEEK